MSLELAAQHLASRGRKGDTMLVHMAPEEVSGLQALARAGGGTLTLNPDTGLPEANFLKQLLPTLIGAGLMFATGGTAAPLIAGISNPALIGLGVGGFEALRTKDLGKGLMAGLGAFGGAGLTSGLMAAGAGAQTAAAQQAAMKAVPESALKAAAAEPTAAAIGQGIQATAPGVVAPGVSPYSLAGTTYGGGPALTAGGSGLGISAATPASQTVTVMPELTRQGVLNQAAANATSAFTPTGGLEQLRAGAGNLGTMANKDTLKYGLAALSGPMMQGSKSTPYVDGKPNYEYTYDSGSGQYTRVPVGTRDTLTQMPRMFADGGPVAEMSDQNQMLTLMANGGQQFATGGQVNLQGTFIAGGPGAGTPNTPQGMQQTMQPPQTPSSMFAPAATDMRATAPLQMAKPQSTTYEQYLAGRNPLQQDVQLTREQFYGRGQAPQGIGGSFAAGGGVSHLGDYSDGGRLLKGPGDGVSDSIPATIANKRPARLADGEFVVPARIVSELGNGSTDAGARKLYAMMDRIQKARGKTTGKDRVAVNSKADRLLPA